MRNPAAAGSVTSTMKRYAAVLAAVTIAVLATARPAAASCAELPDLETAFAEAELVFIGLVEEVSNGGRTAVMYVEDVWKGPQLPLRVTVRGGPEDPELITSVDRTFETNEVYLVFPLNSTPPLEDNICTSTQAVSPAIQAVNPFGEEPDDDHAGETIPGTTSAGPQGLVTTMAAGRDEPGSGSGAGWWIAGGIAAAAALGSAATWSAVRK